MERGAGAGVLRVVVVAPADGFPCRIGVAGVVVDPASGQGQGVDDRGGGALGVAAEGDRVDVRLSCGQGDGGDLGGGRLRGDGQAGHDPSVRGELVHPRPG